MKKRLTSKINDLFGYLRKSSRNLSNLQILFISIFLGLLFSLTLGPLVYDRGKSGLDEIFKLKNSREFSGDIDVEVWVYSWIRTGTINMINAQGPSQWRAVDWSSGCYSRRFTEWNKDYQEALQEACHDLSLIQKKYDNFCLKPNDCIIPSDAIDELNNIMYDLKEAFSEANFVLPYRTNEDNSIE